MISYEHAAELSRGPTAPSGSPPSYTVRMTAEPNRTMMMAPFIVAASFKDTAWFLRARRERRRVQALARSAGRRSCRAEGPRPRDNTTLTLRRRTGRLDTGTRATRSCATCTTARCARAIDPRSTPRRAREPPAVTRASGVTSSERPHPHSFDARATSVVVLLHAPHPLVCAGARDRHRGGRGRDDADRAAAGRPIRAGARGPQGGWWVAKHNRVTVGWRSMRHSMEPGDLKGGEVVGGANASGGAKANRVIVGVASQ